MARPCFPGSFQPSLGQHRCELCPACFFCPENGTNKISINEQMKYMPLLIVFLVLGMTQPFLCQPGFYCPIGGSSQHPCPPGSYGIRSGLAESSECSQCDPGTYCIGSGMTHEQWLFSPENMLILLCLICGADICLFVQGMCHQLALAVLDSCVLEEPSLPPQMIMKLEYHVHLDHIVQPEVLLQYLVPRAHLGTSVTHNSTKQMKKWEHFTL